MSGPASSWVGFILEAKTKAYDQQVTKGLRESHALEQREHKATIERLQTEHGRLQNRLHATSADKLDGRIDRSWVKLRRWLTADHRSSL